MPGIASHARTTLLHGSIRWDPDDKTVITYLESMNYEVGKNLGYHPCMQRCLLAASMLGLWLILGSHPLLAQVAEGGQAVFKSGVDLVTVSATVRDRKGRLVSGLEARDFEVLDRGQHRAISQFRTERAPLSLAILFDISGSMNVAARFTAAKFAAHHLLELLEPGRDEAALFAFDSRLHEVAPFTVDTRALNGALGEVDPFGATSLHDAIAEAADRVAARNHLRRAVVVLTDGIDTSSARTPAEVSGVAAAIDVPVYVIATVLSIDDPGSDRATPQAGRRAPAYIGTVEDLARWTGGALIYASGPASSTRAARDVIDELRNLYLIGFEPGTDTGWHPLEIRTRDDRQTVRARGGYNLTARP
ncbi:MAG: VWA domain-containing protein [Acidobacteria bacterium]|nr:VWA domain-containing protein [Acidobacteriota bacterium]